MIKNLKGLRQNQPEPLAKMTNNSKQGYAFKKNMKESSEEMDFDDWSQSNDIDTNNYVPNQIQKGFYQNKIKNTKLQPQQKVQNYNNNNYYDDDFEESDEMEAIQFDKNGKVNQIIQQQYNMGNATYRKLQHQQSPDMDFDDEDDFDDMSNGQDEDDFGDLQLNVRRFKSSAKKNFVKEEKKPEIVHEFTEGSEFNFEEDQSVSKVDYKVNPVNRNLKHEINTDKKMPIQIYNSNVNQIKATTKIPPNINANNQNYLKPPVQPIAQKNVPVSVEQFEDTFSEDFTQNVGSITNTQMNVNDVKESVDQQKSEVETFKSDFDDYKDSFNVDISNIDNESLPKNIKKNDYKPAPQPQARVISNEITAAIIHDRNVETKYLSNKLDENDAYTKKVKEFLDQKTLEYERLKTKYDLLIKEKVTSDEQNIEYKKNLEIQNVEIEKLVAENDAKQLALDELTERFNKKQEELKAKTKLLQERENLFGNSLNEKKFHTNLTNLSRELEICKVRIEDYQEGIKRYEQRIVELEDELRSSPAALRTKAILQQKIDKLLKVISDNGISVEMNDIQQDNLNEDMIYQEMILNGYIKDNKKLIEENKYLKDKLYNNKLNESKTNFDNPLGRIKELEESVKRLQDELLKKDENYKKQIQKFDQADQILLEREKEIEKLENEKRAAEADFRKEKSLNDNKVRELNNKIKELNELLQTVETSKKKVSDEENNKKFVKNSQAKLQRNIFSQDDQDFKKDIYSMLNTITNENKQVKSEIKDLKETWELKGKTGIVNKLSDIPYQSETIQNPDQYMIDQSSKENQILKRQLEQIRVENTKLTEKVLNLDQQLLDKEKMLKKSEFLQKNLNDERKKLLEIIKNMPKSTRDVDFAVLEQKLINLEKEQKLKSMEIKNAIKTFHNADLSESTDTLHNVKHDWQAEKDKLLAIIKHKNDKIGKFEVYMKTLVDELKRLKTAN